MKTRLHARTSLARLPKVLSAATLLLLSPVVALPSTFVGRVTLGESNAPAEGVVIRLYDNSPTAAASSGGVVAKTEKDGRFEFKDYRAEVVYIRVSPEGFFEGQKFADYTYSDYTTKSIVQNEGGTSNELNFHFDLGGQVTGKVIRSDGTSIGKANVVIESSIQTAKVNLDGSFLIKGVPVGKGDQRLFIYPPPFPTAGNRYRYQKFVDLEGSKIGGRGGPIDLGTISFEPLPAEDNVHCRITSSDGQPIPKGTIYRAYANKGFITQHLIVGEDGQINAAMFAGTWRFYAGEADHRFVCDFTVEIDKVNRFERNDQGFEPQTPSSSSATSKPSK